eukprot:9489829-Pyramimonas_sp.AAC.1
MCVHSPVSGNQAYTEVTCPTAPVPTVASTVSVEAFFRVGKPDERGAAIPAPFQKDPSGAAGKGVARRTEYFGELLLE